MAKSLDAPAEPAGARPGPALPGPSVEPVTRGGVLPASFAQQRLWFLAQLFPASYVYNEPIMMRLDELANPAVVRDCLTEITRRHEAWRTVFPTAAGVPYQQIEPARPFPVEVVDLRSLPAAEREPELYRLAAENARRPFALREGPLVRALLVLTSEEESYLVVTAHHIVVDGVSFFSVFLPELSALYVAFSRKEPSPLPEPTVQYTDFAAWQRDWLSEAELAPRLAYWRAHLASLTDLPLPIDFPRPPELIGRGARVPLGLSAELTQKLRELGHDAGVSLFTTLLAAWKTLLSRYTGQSDIVVSSAAAGRPRPEFDGVIGFFNNLLVLRTQLDDSLTFRELLAKVGTVLKEARAHQDVPFDRLVAELGASRGPYENPLYNNTFLLMPPMPRLALTPGWSVRRFDIGAAKVDLYLELHQGPGGLFGHIEYRTELFAAATIERMVGHLETLLTGIAAQPDARLGELPLLTEGERHQLLHRWNDTAVERPDVCIHEIFAAQAERTPAAIALVFEGQTLTYRELNERANQLAHALQKRGVGPEVLVGVCMERSLELVVALYGVLKAGGAYVPLDPELPKERLSFMLDDTQVGVILTQAHLVGALPESKAARLCMDTDWVVIASEPVHSAPRAGLTLTNLAYVIYTSGSTGQPKGAMNTHRGIQNRLLWMQSAYRLTIADRVLQKTSFGFDVSVWEFFWPLLFGARLVLCRPGGHRDPAYLRKLIVGQGVTTLHFVPALLHAFLEQPDVESCHSIRQLVASGEALSPELAARALTRLPAAALHNLYGPTEAAVDVTAWTCEPGAPLVPIGRPIDNVQIYILDSRGQPVPIGIAGELYIGGIQVGRGYLHRPELTEERFLADPFTSRPEARLYRTGDRARWLAAGVVEYLGRADFQVKLRGIRIELGEIEAVLEKHPAVQQARVVLHKRPDHNDRLVAYVVPDERRARAVRQLLRLERQALLGAQPRYELPNGVTIFHQNKGETDFLYREIFEEQIYERHGVKLHEGAVVFDVGANIGLFALYVQRRFPGTVVYAFEPIPPVFAALRLNAEVHTLNTRLFACGLGSAEKLTEFTYYPHNSVLSGQFANAEADREVVKAYMRNQHGAAASTNAELEVVLASLMAAQRFVCPLRRLSDIIRECQVERIDLLKIDVEKSELAVLSGIDPEDWRKIAQVTLEVHDLDGRLPQITKLLRDQGYQVAVEQNQLLAHTSLYDVYAWRDSSAPPSTVRSQVANQETALRWESPVRLLREVQDFAKLKLPAYMIPAEFVLVDELPLLPSGKVNVQALAALSAATSAGTAVDEVTRSLLTPGAGAASSSGSLERALATTLAAQSPATPGNSVQEAVLGVWRAVLGIHDIGLDQRFFEVGGHSLALARVQAKLAALLGVEVDLITLMRLPTIRALAAYLTAEVPAIPRGAQSPAALPEPRAERPEPIAIVGMAARAPGVHGPDELWEVVRTGREMIRAFTVEELIADGADPTRVRRPDFIRAEGVLDRADHFDAAFFGYSELDAAWMDPQRRLFLECAYEALEHAGCDPASFKGRIGVFAGCGAPLHWMGPVQDALRTAESDHERLRAQTLNAADYLATGVAFKLGLRGPAVTVQTACSTSLAAVHLARRSLLAGECDVVLAGGSSLASLREADRGFLGAAPGLMSQDGHCRPFDAEASGMVRASGTAIVVMKRLTTALADGDTIHALVIGSALNNDGADKLGFTTPSENGVAAVVEQVYAAAGIDPGSVGFVEAHGTGTRLGDPTEVRALSRVFRQWTQQKAFCALGSLKGNLGHLDTAAGVASVIKTTLALTHELIPPQAGFRTPNPLLELPSTPFFVSPTPLPWPRTKSPRRAGVNALGIGGTNVHVLLEEAPPAAASGPDRPLQLLGISARTPTALAATARRLGAHLGKYPAASVADVAHTLLVGRTAHEYRATLVVRDLQEARAALAATVPPVSSAGEAKSGPNRPNRPVVFLFSGHGTHYVRMGVEVYAADPQFRAEVDRCFAITREIAGLDLGSLWRGESPDGERQIDEIPYAQTLLFTIEYALAKRFLDWGIRPAALLGHSLGEYVAACIAGVFSVHDALALLALRGQLFASTPPGSMLMVFAEPHQVLPYLGTDVAVATYAPGHVVLSGLVAAVEQARLRLANAGIETNAVRATRAGHSPAVRPIRDTFRSHVAKLQLRAPSIPIISNLTGRVMTEEQATSPDAWADHLCSPVQLTDGLGAVLDLDATICIELGPGSSLGSALKRHPRFAATMPDVVTTLPDYRKREESSYKVLLRGLGRVWELGVAVDWSAFYAHQGRRRVPLPTYPFEGRRFSLHATPPAAPPKPDELDVRSATIARELGVRGVDSYPGLKSRLTALCASLVRDFFRRQLGSGIGRAFSFESLHRELRILPDFAKMLKFFVTLLEREELLSRSPAGVIHLHALVDKRSAELTAGLVKDYPDFTGLVQLISHCVARYHEALTGIVQPLSVVFPDGTDALYRSYMRQNVQYMHESVYLALARALVLETVLQRNGHKTRILEIGAGHGTLTWPLVEQLRGLNVEYHFTDIGRSILQGAEAEAERRNIPWLKSLRFDLNLPPETQGILDRYDLILGFNVINVAKEPATALKNLHDLLVPSGSAIFVTRTQLYPWEDLVFGLSPGYWEAAEYARGEPSSNLAFWEDVLRGGEFSQVVSAPVQASRRAAEECGLLWARPKSGPTGAARPASLREAPPAAIDATSSASSDIGAPAVLARPTDDPEQLVKSTWTRLLGAKHLPVETSFFELGGDSLLVVQLLAEIRAKTGHEIKLRQFTARPTVGGMTALLQKTDAHPYVPASALADPVSSRPVRLEHTEEQVDSSVPDCLIPLQSAGEKRPFYCVHPIGGSALYYAALAKSIDPQRPFWGIQSPMLEEHSARPASIEELSARYVAAIRSVQPIGPYLLGGFSFGGVIAIEMARQLQQGGQQVAKLVLLDVAGGAGILA